jgi:hypothetical protein
MIMNKGKRKFIILIASSFIGLIYFGASFSSDILTYRNEQFGFEISYSDKWSKATNPNNPAFFISRNSTEEPATMSIHVANFSGDRKEIMNELAGTAEILIENYRQRFPDATVIEKGPTSLGSFPAYYISVKYSLKNLNIDIDLTTLQIVCIKGSKIYVVNFETPLLVYKKTFKEFQSYLATFNFR